MRVLICFDSLEEAQLLQMGKELLSKVVDDGSGTLHHIPFHCHTFEGMQVDWLCLNKNVYDAQYRLMHILRLNRYHLILHFGTCLAVGDYLQPGDVVNVIQEKPCYFEMDTDRVVGGFEHGAFEQGAYPQQRGGYINMTNAYFNVFIDFEKVAGVTLPSENFPNLVPITKGLQASVISVNGMAFAYACLAAKQPFYQILVVRENKETGAKDPAFAREQLSTVAEYILDKIK